MQYPVTRASRNPILVPASQGPGCTEYSEGMAKFASHGPSAL